LIKNLNDENKNAINNSANLKVTVSIFKNETN